MKNIFCVDLNLPVPPDLRELDRVKTIDSNLKVWNHFLIDIDNNLNEFLKKYGLEICYAEIFYTPPNTSSFIHADLDDPKYLLKKNTASRCKLNYVFGADGSYMQWFKYKNLNKDIKKMQTRFDAPYLRYKDHECDLIYSTKTKQPSLVEVVIPHNVLNCTNEPRWCISYLLYDRHHNVMPTWKDVSKRLREFVVP